MKFPKFNKKQKPQKPVTRTFGGKTDNFTDNQERHFYQRMLRAYLKGWEVFYFGFIMTPIGKRPAEHKVSVIWK
jgi:hypothetical protein